MGSGAFPLPGSKAAGEARWWWGRGGTENHGENKLIVLFRLPCWIPRRGGSCRSDAIGGGAARCRGRGKE